MPPITRFSSGLFAIARQLKGLLFVPLMGLFALLLITTANGATEPQLTTTPQTPHSAEHLPYQSAFERYRPYQEDPLQSWQQANERVQRLGGWRYYARESQASPTVQHPPSSAPAEHQHHGDTRRTGTQP